MNLTTCLLSLPALLSSSVDLEFNATAKSTMWILNGVPTQLIELDVLVQGEDAGLAVARRSMPKITTAKASNGSRLKRFVGGWSTGGLSPIRHDPDEPADHFDFRVSLLEPDRGAEQISRLRGKLDVLMAKSVLDLEVSVPEGEEPTKVKHAALKKAKTNLEVWTVAYESLYFEFTSLDDGDEKALDLDLDLDRQPKLGGFCYGGGVFTKIIRFDCPGHRMGKGETLTLRTKDADGQEFTMTFEDLQGTPELTPIESERLERAGLQGKIQAVTVHEVHTRVTGTSFAIGNLELLSGDEPAKMMMSWSDANDGLPTCEYLLNQPPVDLKLVGRVYAGLKWTSVPFELEDVPVEH
jgi:hypothetical protein